jgi:hypothetical protein
VFRGERAFDAVMREYQQVRDAKALPIYGFTTELATLDPPPPQMQTLFAAIQGNQAAVDGFVSVAAGTVSPADYFAPDNIGKLLAHA